MERAEMEPTEQAIELQLEGKELALLRTGLQMLEDTFGHEEAEELEEVQALLARLDQLEGTHGRSRA